MPSPFPGMDLFLENGELWSEVHSRLIVAIADAIAPDLLPSYYVAIEKRTYLSTPESERPLPRPLVPSSQVWERGETARAMALRSIPLLPELGARG